MKIFVNNFIRDKNNTSVRSHVDNNNNSILYFRQCRTTEILQGDIVYFEDYNVEARIWTYRLALMLYLLVITVYQGIIIWDTIIIIWV